MSVSPIAPVTSALPAETVTAVDDVATAPGAAAGTIDAAALDVPPPASPAPATQAVDAAKAAAAIRQGALAPLLADLEAAIASPALAGQAKAAIAQVLALQISTDAPVTGQVVKDAVAQSGLFLEAHFAQAATGGPTPPVDLKAALLVLQRTLAAVQAPAQTRTPGPATPAATATPAAPSATATPALSAPARAAIAQVLSLQTPSSSAAPPQTLVATVAKASQVIAADLAQLTPPAGEEPAPELRAPLLVLQRALATLAANGAALAPRVVTAFPSPAEIPASPPSSAAVPQPAKSTAPPTSAPQLPPAGQITPEMIEAAVLKAETPLDAESALPPREDLPEEVKAALSVLRQALAAGPAVRLAPPTRTAPPPPLRQSATTAQAAEPATLPASDDPVVVARHLSSETDQALARLNLHQLASLPDGTAPAWMFELPLNTPQGSSTAQFVIERDDQPQGDPDAGPAWRARFSMNVPPMGPVHIHLRVARERSAVTLWAERQDGLERLRAQGPALAAALSADVTIHPGMPPRPSAAPGPGQFIDQTS